MSATINPVGSRGGHSYNEACRRTYLKYREVKLAKAKEYYAAKADVRKAARMARYYSQKAAKAVVASNPNDDKSPDESS
jgi:hypothetical protein